MMFYSQWLTSTALTTFNNWAFSRPSAAMLEFSINEISELWEMNSLSMYEFSNVWELTNMNATKMLFSLLKNEPRHG